jgi:hypothetical protein
MLLAEGSTHAECLRIPVSMPLPAIMQRGWQPDPPDRRGVAWRVDANGIDVPDRLLPDTGSVTAPPFAPGSNQDRPDTRSVRQRHQFLRLDPIAPQAS